MFQINTQQITAYINLLHTYSIFGHIHISAMAVLSNGMCVITSNTTTEHAEQILLSMYKYDIIAMFVSHEPCISCGFNILYNQIPYLFFSNYNYEYGFTTCINISKYNTVIYGGLYTQSTLSAFFQTKR